MLIQAEPNQQRHGILGDQLVSLVRVREVKAVGHPLDPTERLREVPDNAELVRARQDVANHGRVEDQLALSHPEFEMTEHGSLPGPAHVRGLEALRSYC